MITPERLFGQRIGRVIHSWIDKINEINRKYAEPKIQMSGGVKFALLILRLYLIFLVLLLAYKFYTMLR
jgi:hypothetical protein